MQLQRIDEMIPFTCAPEIVAFARRIAEQQDWTVPEAIAYLLQRGVEEHNRGAESLQSAHDRFMKAPAGAEQDEAGDDLIRVIFGPDCIA